MSQSLNEILNPEIRQLLQDEIRSDEKLIWADQPIPRWFSCGTMGMMLFAIPWTGFAVFWTTMAFIGTHSIGHNGGAFEKGFQIFFPLFGLPFVLIGLGMLSSPIWIIRGLKRTVYAVTTQRAIVCKKGFWGTKNIQSFDPDRLTKMERNERADGSGDLIFEQFTTRRGSGYQTTRRGFISVKNVREVDDILRKTLLANRVREVV